MKNADGQNTVNKMMSAGVSKKTRQRILAMFIVFVIVGVIPVSAQLINIQLVRHEEYESKAISQQTRDTSLTPARGTIYDRNMKKLAVSASVETVFITPRAIKNEAQANLIADGLSEILGVDRDTIYERTQKSKSYYEEIKKKVEKETADLVRQFKIDNKLNAIDLVPDTKRYYPYGTFASAIIGFVGTDNYGLQGVEAYYDKELQGLPGKIVTAKNAGGTEMPFDYEQYIDAQNGLSLVLTIDEVIQHYAEKYLKQAVFEHNAVKGGAALVMNCKTGEILALSNYPDYNLNSPFEILDQSVSAAIAQAADEDKSAIRVDYLNNLWRNKAVSDTYEPGSTFKTLTASIGLEEGVVSQNTTFSCPGFYYVGDRKVKCWKSGGHGHETFVDGLSNSCNVVFMQLGMAIGAEKFYDYNTAFGFREKTGIDLPGEATGVLHSRSVIENVVSLAIASFGQTFRVTPIQMLTAVSSIANGGSIVKPHVAKSFVDDDGNIVKNVDTTVKRQVMSSDTAAKVRAMMEEVVSSGTGKNAYIQGYKVAGKTATSEKTDQRNESGQVDKYIASFIGFAPADDPEIAVLVILDEPNTYTNSGGLLCAPAVKNILIETLPYLGIAPAYTAEELSNLDLAVPNVLGLSEQEAKNKIVEAGFRYSIEGSGNTVTEQVPGVGEKLGKNSRVILYLGEKEGDVIEVPRVLGLSAEEARQTLAAAGLNFKVGGSGSVSDSSFKASRQSPQPGGKVASGTVVTVEFLSDTTGDEGIVSSDNLIG